MAKQPDTYRMILTGPWAGFGFSRHKFYTPENHEFEPGEMTWLSLMCNIVREWRALLEDERRARGLELEALGNSLELEMAGKPCATRVSKTRARSTNVICLREVLRARREKRLSGVDGSEAGTLPTGRHHQRGRTRTRRIKG